MRISNKKATNSRRRNIAILVVIIVLIVCGIGYYLLEKNKQSALENNKTLQPSGSAKNDVINGGKDSTTPSTGLPDESTSTTSDQVPTSDTLSVSIITTSQSNGMVRASATTNGSGTCVFQYKPADGGKPVTKQVEVTNNGCSFEASQNEFSYLGKWTLTVTYYSNNSKAEATQDVTIH